MIRLASAASLFMLAGAASAQDVVLSGLLGGPPGTAVHAANPPLVPFVDLPIYGLGVDCPGSWTPVLIQFIDAGPFAHGVGQHPPQTGESRVDFDLEAMRNAAGRELASFEAVVGIEFITSSANNGARFAVRLDGVEVLARVAAGRLSPSSAVSVPLGGAATLSLVTTAVGGFNSNHACWAAARVVLGEPLCPADFNRDGFLDFFDYDDYVRCFESGDCPPGRTADFNGDGFADFFDYDDFVAAFQAGC